MAVRLAASEVGAGPPLVILHGLFGARRNWASIAAALGKARRVVTADLRNHGESPWHDRHDYPALAEDLACLIRERAADGADVLGHSMGGKAAMTLAILSPELVRRLVVVDIAPALSRGTSPALVRAMQGVPLERCSRRTDVSAALAEAVPDPAVRAFLAQAVTSRPEGLAWSFNLEAIAAQFDTILGFPDLPAGRRFSGPVLFIAGGRSDFLGAEHWPGILGFFPAARLERIPEAGHWVHADAPAAFLEVVERFLEG